MVQTSVFEQIENDGEHAGNHWDRQDKLETIIFSQEFLKTFLTKEKSEAAQNLSFPEQIKKLTDGLELISYELKQKIRHDYPTLIKHSSKCNDVIQMEYFS